MFRNEHRWNLIFFLAWHVIESLLHKEESSLIFSAKSWFALVRRLFHKKRVYYQKAINIQQSFHKEIIINPCTNILFLGKHRMTCWELRSICPNSVEFPKHVTLLITAKQKVQYDLQSCVTPQLSLLLFRFVAFYYNMKLIYCSVLFLRRFKCKAAKNAKEKKEIIKAL